MALVGDMINLGIKPLSMTRHREIYIPFAQVRTLRATPKELVPAQGAGRMLQLVSGAVKLLYAGVAYTESADNLVVRYASTTGVVVSQVIEMTGFITLTANSMTQFYPAVDPIVSYAAGVNASLVLHNNGDGEFGNSGTSALRIYIAYRIWDVSKGIV